MKVWPEGSPLIERAQAAWQAFKNKKTSGLEKE